MIWLIIILNYIPTRSERTSTCLYYSLSKYGATVNIYKNTKMKTETLRKKHFRGYSLPLHWSFNFRYPSKQLQIYPPSVFSQVSLDLSQRFVLVKVHSSMSLKKNENTDTTIWGFFSSENQYEFRGKMHACTNKDYIDDSFQKMSWFLVKQ